MAHSPKHRHNYRQLILNLIMDQAQRLKNQPPIICCDRYKENQIVDPFVETIVCEFCGGTVVVPQTLEPKHVEALAEIEKAMTGAAE